jgi:hypothetical protein
MVDVQSTHLPICTQRRVLIKRKRTSWRCSPGRRMRPSQRSGSAPSKLWQVAPDPSADRRRCGRIPHGVRTGAFRRSTEHQCHLDGSSSAGAAALASHLDLRCALTRSRRPSCGWHRRTMAPPASRKTFRPLLRLRVIHSLGRKRITGRDETVRTSTAADHFCLQPSCVVTCAGGVTRLGPTGDRGCAPWPARPTRSRSQAPGVCLLTDARLLSDVRAPRDRGQHRIPWQVASP